MSTAHLFRRVVTLTHAQILALPGAPVTIVPAPGSASLIIPVSAMATWHTPSLIAYSAHLSDWDLVTNVVFPTIEPETVPVMALGAAGSVDNGNHVVGVSFLTATGETAASGRVGITVTGNKRVNLSAIPIGNSAVAGRRIYFGKVGEATLHLVETINNNTATTTTINVADTGLTGAAPSITNTTGVVSTWATGPTTQQFGLSAPTIVRDELLVFTIAFSRAALPLYLGQPMRLRVTTPGTITGGDAANTLRVTVCYHVEKA